ncbi:endoglycoceramidase, putative [Schistosoma mansoni]|uniref:endoglycoceramidase, putative n=1 Tax=Schistosoma mansoni TaxID=6183 RepID=UPI00022C85F7|nr:endoglycoceramidase, putative [Schistosoma mansoni]|eukprot:XP_018647340.1 endoglycoceramidase, putative [Schistosoma mansoni]
MQRVPGLLQDEMARKKSVLSYHYYCWLLQSTPATEHMPSWKQYLCDQVRVSLPGLLFVVYVHFEYLMI